MYNMAAMYREDKTEYQLKPTNQQLSESRGDNLVSYTAVWHGGALTV